MSLQNKNTDVSQSSSGTIYTLPEEIWVKIFSYLSHYDVFQNVRHVSDNWSHLSLSASLWKYVDLERETTEFEECHEKNRITSLLHHMLKNVACHVQHLRLGKNSERFVFEKNNEIINFPKVKTLELETNVITDCEIISGLIDYFPDLRNVRLHFEDVVPSNMWSLRNMDAVELRFSTSGGCFAGFFLVNECFENEIRNLTNIRELEADNISSDLLNELVCNCSMLCCLSIKRCSLVGPEAFNSIPSLQQLTSLNLDETFIDDKCLLIIVAHAPGLNKLSLQECVYITDIGFSHIGRHCTKLESLRVDKHASSKGRNITNVGVDFVASGCRNLKVFVAKYCHAITDLGLQSLAEHCHGLLVLKVTGCSGITDKGVESVAIGCPWLRYMDINECVKVTCSAVNKLIGTCIWLENVKCDSCNFISRLTFAPFFQKTFSVSTQNCKIINHQNVDIMPLLNGKEEENIICDGTVDNNMSTNNIDSSYSNKTQIHDILKRTGYADSKTDDRKFAINEKCTLNSQTFGHAWTRHSHLRKLSFNFCSNITDSSIYQIADHCPDLHEFYLIGTYLTSDDSISYSLKKCVFLQVLDISGGSTLGTSNFTNETLFSAGNYGKHLEKLTMQKNYNITITGIKTLIWSCKRLNELSITARYSKDQIGVYQVSQGECSELVEEFGKHRAQLTFWESFKVVTIKIVIWNRTRENVSPSNDYR